MSFKDRPELLGLLAQVIDYTCPQQILELHDMLTVWAKPSPAQAVCLLDAIYADETLRFYAVTCLEDFKDEELRLYLLPLT